jgi:putative membrane protein
VGDDHAAERDRLVRRHIAYVHTLRCLLREQDPHEDEDVRRYLDEAEREGLRGSSNMTARLLRGQLRELRQLYDAGAVNDLRLQSFDESIRHLFDIQGGCERIKKTPLPRAYGFIAERLILWFSALLPCALVHDLGWATIPIALLVGLGFRLISETGRVLEDPFNLFWNALPLMALSRTIEVNLLELLGVDELPPMIQPDNNQVLM